ncbi:hypothetical protein D3C84_1074380 [compost metagenome]
MHVLALKRLKFTLQVMFDDVVLCHRDRGPDQHAVDDRNEGRKGDQYGEDPDKKGISGGSQAGILFRGG